MEEAEERRSTCSTENMKFTIKKATVFFLILIGYMYAGAFLFIYIEECNDNPIVTTNQLTDVPMLMEICHDIRQWLNKSDVHANKTKQLNEILQKCNNQTTKSNKRTCNISDYKLITKWFYFCFVSVFTIGYGNVVVQTNLGKLFTIFYIMIGIPLGFMFTTTVSDNIMAFQLFLLRKFEKNMKKIQNIQLKMLIANIFGLLVNIFTAAILHTFTSKLVFLDSVYFIIITTTTVGYGDYFYLEKEVADGLSYMLLLVELFFILTGLSLTCTVFNCVSDIFAHSTSKGICCKKSKD